MGQSRTEIIKEFIANTANQIDMGDSKPIRIGVFTNNCPSSKDIHLNEHGNKFTFIQELRSNNKMTKTHILKRVRRRGFTKANGGRADARRLIVTFVDGPLDNSKDVFLEAERVRKFNMDVFVIAIGNEVKENELRKLASVRPKEHIFRVTSYDNLKISFNDFIDKICECKHSFFSLSLKHYIFLYNYHNRLYLLNWSLISCTCHELYYFRYYLLLCIQ